MAKRQHIEIVRDDTLKLIDDDLDAAMERLDGTNERVDVILSGIEDPPTDAPPSQAGPVNFPVEPSNTEKSAPTSNESD